MPEGDDTGRAVAAPLAVGAALVFLAGAEVASTATGEPSADGNLLRASDEGATEARTVYGLTAADLGGLVDAAADDDFEGLVALHPGAGELDAPLLTRAEAPRTLLASAERETANLRDTSGAWRQVVFPDRDPSDRVPKLRRAEVTVADEDGADRCPRIGLDRFSCAPPSWADVRYRELSVGGSDERCIWVHPLENRTIRVDYGRLSPDLLADLELRTALADKVVGEPGAVRVELSVGDETESSDHPPDQKGWRTRELPGPDSPSRLAVAISAERVGRRHFCFRFDAR